MNNKTILEMLTPNSVNIKTQDYISINGSEYAIGVPHNVSYVNSEIDRQHLSDEVAEPYLSVILKMWGNKPTVFIDENIKGE